MPDPTPSAARRLSPKMRLALDLMAAGGLGYVHSGPDVFEDSHEAWVGHRTAKALQRRGLARIDWTDCIPGEDYPELSITDAGLEAARRGR